jgi:hypothetical protein
MTGTTEQKKPLGIFRDETLQAELRRVAHLHNDAASGSAYTNTARAIMATYPELTVAEREQQLGCFQHHIELTEVRTKQDHSNVLPEVARILGISRQ